MYEINGFNDFCNALRCSGFSMGGGNDKGVHAVIPFSWENTPIDSKIRWHTGEPETDPWEWRMRVLEEQSDIAYAKLFFGTSGYITAEWYPEFLAVRREGMVFEEAYYNGCLSRTAARIYEVISGNGVAALHEIKRLGGFTKEENGRFDRALTELQMKMYITMCGRMQKKNKLGEEYGWSSTVFETVESFWKKRGVELPEKEPQRAFEAIEARIWQLNPDADPKAVRKFIKG